MIALGEQSCCRAALNRLSWRDLVTLVTKRTSNGCRTRSIGRLTFRELSVANSALRIRSKCTICPRGTLYLPSSGRGSGCVIGAVLPTRERACCVIDASTKKRNDARVCVMLFPLRQNLMTTQTHCVNGASRNLFVDASSGRALFVVDVEPLSSVPLDRIVIVIGIEQAGI